MLRMLDHVVYVARDLDEAVAEYRRRGFTVTAGGEHVDGITHNALVAFADGAYLELVGFRSAAPQHRWWRHAAEGSFADFALLSDDLEADVAALGALVARPGADGGRARPDGITLRWRTALLAPPLPFLIEDLTPRELRVPAGDAARHANGATGIERVAVGCVDLAAAEGAYARLRERGGPNVLLRASASDGVAEIRYAGGSA